MAKTPFIRLKKGKQYCDINVVKTLIIDTFLTGTSQSLLEAQVHTR